jgi:catechol 2,3-dioxygenase-like lactoylglutathione lyase family enzyme
MSDDGRRQDARALVRIGGVALNVSDIARSEAFYVDVIGLKVALRVPSDHQPMEVALCVSGSVQGGDAMLVLARIGVETQSGQNSFGRVILNSPDAAALAQKASVAGYLATKVEAARPVYMITDPDGYMVEVFQASVEEAPYP